MAWVDVTEKTQLDRRRPSRPARKAVELVNVQKVRARPTAGPSTEQGDVDEVQFDEEKCPV